MNINNFSKTKGLSENQALNKNLSNSKRQKTTSIQFTAKKKFFFSRCLAIEWHKVAKIFPDRVTQFFQHTVRLFWKVCFVKLSSRKDLIYLLCYYFCFLFHQHPAQLSLLLYKFNEKKAKTKKFSKTLNTKATKNYVERACPHKKN